MWDGRSHHFSAARGSWSLRCGSPHTAGHGASEDGSLGAENKDQRRRDPELRQQQETKTPPHPGNRPVRSSCMPDWTRYFKNLSLCTTEARRFGCTALAPSVGLLLSQRRRTLPSAAILIIYRDLIIHDEMFSDIYKIREIADGLWLEVEGKMVSRTEGNIDDSLIGGNASALGRRYRSRGAGLAGARSSERALCSRSGARAAEQIKHILANFKNYQFFIGENMNPDGMVALLDYREDGVTPYMIFFKDGLEMEKC
ncbi:tRNA 2'-phosphotransferase [Saguinus oedipus]|uniref:Translationally-controlled tumor protein n=1 Tax=Saguinus oedipus TaxID=9490 RepID=A0ABQ9TV17_SAGOE|nr:tRNA 2'-phosphotransferase [Saguinus oedipus]